ncbi:MAG: PD40 domain-containing protein [Bacteroidales bacterium]|nr:PD40 domain-containing protein [Bacteroidales bacterium]
MKKTLLLTIVLLVALSACEKESTDPDPIADTKTYTKLTNSTSNSEYAGCYSTADTKIYYRSNISAMSSGTYDIWRMNVDGSNQEKILNFSVSGGGAQTGGLFDISGDRLSFYESNSIHEMLALDLTKTFPINRDTYNGASDGLSVLLTVPGGLGAAFVNFHEGTDKGAWVIRTSLNGVSPTVVQLRIADKASITGANANAIGSILLTALQISEIYSFSPDGSQMAIAYVPTGSESTVKQDVYIINTSDGSIAQRLTSEGENGISSSNPAWSPNGSLIAFDRRDADGNYQIYTIKPDGTGLTQLTKKEDSIEGETDVLSWSSPIWIDNNTLIINRLGTSYRQVWKVKF